MASSIASLSSASAKFVIKIDNAESGHELKDAEDQQVCAAGHSSAQQECAANLTSPISPIVT